MDFTAETPRDELTINGKVVNVPQPYNEGHVLTANEASVLNQTLKENLRNNFAGTMKKLAEEGKTDEEIQAAFDEYAAGYAFGVRRVGSGESRTVDPVVKAARVIAREKVKAAITAKGIKLKDVPAEQIATLVQKLIDKDASIMDAARAQVEAAKSVGAAALDLSDLDIGGSETAAA